MSLIPTVTMAEVIDYILDHADSADIDRVYEAAKMRHKTLQAKAASAVRIGMTIRLNGISPKYLNGMTGEVVSIDRQRASVLLDERSTRTLRVKGGRRFYIPADVKQYEVSGVPLSTCHEV